MRVDHSGILRGIASLGFAEKIGIGIEFPAVGHRVLSFLELLVVFYDMGSLDASLVLVGVA